MKKRNLKSLSLNKKIVSNLDESIKGGANNSIYLSCVNYTKKAGGCFEPPFVSIKATECVTRCLNECVKPG